MISLQNSSTKDDFLEIKFNNRIQVDDKIASGLARGVYLLIVEVFSVDTLPFTLTKIKSKKYIELILFTIKFTKSF